MISVVEQDQAQYQITALAYNASKYAYVERGRPLTQRDVSDLNEIPDAPTTLNISETLYTYQSQVRAKVIASWPSVLGIAQYRVKWRKDNANWSIADVLTNDYEILDITPGLFEVQVFSMNAAMKLSTTAATDSINALGKTAPPANVTGFTSVLDGNIGVTLTWNPIADLDLSEYEIRQGSTWASSTFVTRVAATSYKLGQLAPGTLTYLIRGHHFTAVCADRHRHSGWRLGDTDLAGFNRQLLHCRLRAALKRWRDRRNQNHNHLAADRLERRTNLLREGCRPGRQRKR
ncbi:MAG: hypothetical protein EB010_07620 [Acidimicrobiia bacterium]|nr:hypothetical protein [Acidimicrobiia bacterium]